MPTGVYKRSEENNKKMSETLKLRGIKPKLTDEIREKMSIARLGKSPWNKGKKGEHLSEDSREKMRQAKLKNPVRYWAGKKREQYVIDAIVKSRKGVSPSEETREKMRASMKKRVSEGKCHLWKGGISTYERKLWYCNKRRVRKIGNGGSHSLQEWEIMKGQYNYQCPSCSRFEPVIKLSRDHIIPLIRGGSDSIENIQPLCRSCNSKKHTKTIKYKRA